MSFKGEIALGALNTKYKYGFTVGDIYRVQGSGNLVPNNYPVSNGEFVEWTANGWRHSDAHYVTDAESVDIIAQNLGLIREDVFDNGAPSVSTVLRVSEDTYDAYDVDNYWTRDGILYKITSKIHAADSDVWQFGVTSMGGVVPALNQLVDSIAAGAAGAKWTKRTATISVNGGTTEEINIQDHEFVTLTTLHTGSNIDGTLVLHLNGECYVHLDKAFRTKVRPLVGDANPTSLINTGIASFDPDITAVMKLLGSGVPDEYDPSFFDMGYALSSDTSFTINQPSLMESDDAVMLLHSLGEGTLIVIPLPS